MVSRINVEQDYSEAFVFSKKQLGWDYTSMYWSFRQPNFAITLGDYRVTWGLGSVLSRHFQLQSLFIPSTWAGIQMHGKPHTSLNEVNRMRGICLDIYQKKLHGNVVLTISMSMENQEIHLYGLTQIKVFTKVNSSNFAVKLFH